MSNLNNFLKTFSDSNQEDIKNQEIEKENKEIEIKETPDENLFNIKEENKNIPKRKLNLKKKYELKENILEEMQIEAKEESKEIEEIIRKQMVEETPIDVEKMFQDSETPIMFKDQWLKLYEKALNSDKQTMTNRKVRNGKFRLNETGTFEILPDFKTKGKSSNHLLHEVWKINND